MRDDEEEEKEETEQKEQEDVRGLYISIYHVYVCLSLNHIYGRSMV